MRQEQIPTHRLPRKLSLRRCTQRSMPSRRSATHRATRAKRFVPMRLPEGCRGPRSPLGPKHATRQSSSRPLIWPPLGAALRARSQDMPLSPSSGPNVPALSLSPIALASRLRCARPNRSRVKRGVRSDRRHMPHQRERRGHTDDRHDQRERRGDRRCQEHAVHARRDACRKTRDQGRDGVSEDRRQ